jgi:HEAT repeat protein
LEKRLATVTDWELAYRVVDLLVAIRDPRSPRIIENRLRGDLKSGQTWLRRVCYIGLGELGDKGSEPLLLEAERTEAPRPDDALLWALARCGTKNCIPVLRKYLNSDTKDVRLAAIAGLGIAGDRESTDMLIKTARDARNPNTRFNAVYALGLLRANHAVPLLIELLQPVPNYSVSYCPEGIYGKDGMYTEEADTDVCIRALGRIGDRRAIPEFERILKDDRYFLDYDRVAEAVAEAGWRELVPAIIDRMEKDYKKNVDMFGHNYEKCASALRRLTGQTFGEDPRAWRMWQQKQKDREPPRSSHGTNDQGSAARK